MTYRISELGPYGQLKSSSSIVWPKAHNIDESSYGISNAHPPTRAKTPSPSQRVPNKILKKLIFAGNNVDDRVHIRVIIEKIKKIQITNLRKKNQR